MADQSSITFEDLAEIRRQQEEEEIAIKAIEQSLEQHYSRLNSIIAILKHQLRDV